MLCYSSLTKNFGGVSYGYNKKKSKCKIYEFKGDFIPMHPVTSVLTLIMRPLGSNIVLHYAFVPRSKEDDKQLTFERYDLFYTLTPRIMKYFTSYILSYRRRNNLDTNDPLHLHADVLFDNMDSLIKNLQLMGVKELTHETYKAFVRLFVLRSMRMSNLLNSKFFTNSAELNKERNNIMYSRKDALLDFGEDITFSKNDYLNQSQIPVSIPLIKVCPSNTVYSITADLDTSLIKDIYGKYGIFPDSICLANQLKYDGNPDYIKDGGFILGVLYKQLKFKHPDVYKTIVSEFASNNLKLGPNASIFWYNTKKQTKVQLQ